MKAAILYEARQPLKIEELEMPAVGDEDVLGSGPFTISSGNFVTREITITGVSSRQANDVEEVFQMASAGRIELKSLITKSYRYDEINEALNDLEHGKLRMGVSLWN